MSKRHHDAGPFTLVENYSYTDGTTRIFSDGDEEERYQAFKARLLREVVATGSFLEHGWCGEFRKETQKLELIEVTP
jgi:hypothetical protein